MQNRKFKVIKCYPNSPNLNTIHYLNAVCGKKDWLHWKLENDSSNTIYILEEPWKYSEYWEEVKEKEFEILDYEYIPGKSGCNYTGINSTQFLTNKKIIRVRRLSNGEIFSVGDKVKYPQGSIKWNIDNFYIREDGILLVRSKDCINVETISTIEHCKEPLFLDELGNELYKGDMYYFVVEYDRAVIPTAWEFRSGIIDWDNPDKPMLGRVQFKYRKDAENYINENKPMFSKKQIKDALDKSDFRVDIFGRIINGLSEISKFKKVLGL